ncbi:MAG: SagB/ThcOx family dehydrogenase [Defluviitaleaceae bacterium]|nr:SagB/ThcOx family dehydrogenase [Defluviitaleaceae bacterium]
MENNQIKQNRDFMKCPILGEAMKVSDQSKGLPHPPHGKMVDTPLITLQSFNEEHNNPIKAGDYSTLLDIRRSVRTYGKTVTMTQAQLAFLLYSTQGIQEYRGKNEAFTLRTVPSGGCRHPFETYIAVRNVEDLQPGIYYYSPMAYVGEKKVAITFLETLEDYENRITQMLAGQSWAANAPVVLFLTCVPYRSEWRYEKHSHRVMLIDLGHVGQNIMLSAAAMGLGSCCMAAYDQDLCDKALNLDGVDEYMVYAASVGMSVT